MTSMTVSKSFVMLVIYPFTGGMETYPQAKKQSVR